LKLLIVYDNEVFSRELDVKSDWGFSCLVDNGVEKILFDTGAKGDLLIWNLKQLGVDPSEISKVVISHEHWDHNGGLGELSRFINGGEIYRLSREEIKGFSINVVEHPLEIADGVYSTGRLHGVVDEQSLILEGKEGWTILVGCSHPGVDKILSEARRRGEVVGLIGGMHGFKDFYLLEDLKIISPCHCTKYKRDISELYPEKTFRCGVGRIFEL